MLTQQRLMELLDYDQQTGAFVWRQTKGNVKTGTLAGGLTPSGYLIIVIDGQRYRAHHLAWLYIYGQLPSQFLDHKNRIRNDNRIENLREATWSQNFANKGIDERNKSGLKGVSWDKQKKKWAAFIKKDKKSRFLGRYDVKEQAHAAYMAAAKELFGEFARAA